MKITKIPSPANPTSGVAPAPGCPLHALPAPPSVAQDLVALVPEDAASVVPLDGRALRATPLFALLRVLPDAYVRSLAPEVQAEIQRRLQRDPH